MKTVQCTACREQYDLDRFNRCPNCGSRTYRTEEELYDEKQNRIQRTQEELLKREKVEQEYKMLRTRIFQIAAILFCAFIIFVIVIGIKIRISIQQRAVQKSIENSISNHDYTDALLKIDGLDDEEKKKKLNNLIVNDAVMYSQALADGGDYNMAYSVLNTVSGIGSTAAVDEKKKEICISQVMEKLSEYDQNNNIDGAIMYLTESIAQYGLDSGQIAQRLLPYTEKYKVSIFREADSYVQSGEFEKALTKIEYLANVINDGEVKARMASILLNILGSDVFSGDLTSAIQYLKGYINKYDLNDKDLSAVYAAYTDQYKSNVFQQAEESFQNDGYSSALAVLDEAYSIVPDNEIQEKYDHYKELKPVELLALMPYVGDNMESYSRSIHDSFGNTFNDVYNGRVGNNGDYALDFDNIYEINGKYSTLSATLFVTEYAKNFENDNEFVIYGDNEVLYSFHGNGELGIKPVNIQVDISGVTDLRLVLNDHYSSSMAVDSIFLHP